MTVRKGKHTILFTMSDPLRAYRLRKEYSSRINRVIDYINQHLCEELTLETLASVALFSPYHFHRVFHTMVGETLNGYINRLRLEKAAHKLHRNLNLSITEIALECGFSSSSAFTRAFKAFFQQSPRDYRSMFLESKGVCLPSEEQPYGNSSVPTFSQMPLEPSQYARFRGFTFNTRVEHLPSYNLAYIRLIGFKEFTFNENINRTFDRLACWLQARDLFSDDSLCIGLTYDDTEITDPERCRYMCCFTVPEGTVTEGEVGTVRTPASKYVVSRLEGQWADYGELFGTTLEYLYGVWFPQSGYEPGEGLSYLEKYYRYKSGKLNMDLCVPVKPV
ncbi:MAG: AraC family transcriptional regulator [Spirochaetales bacterium]|nr:AraC family transcriptional regulator [Spirochaetales bacterium]